MDDDNELGLAEAIEVVRSELRRAQDLGRLSDVRFSVGSVEVDLAVEIVKTRGGEASIKVLSILSLGAKGGVAKGQTSTVKVVLNPVGVDGGPFEVASALDHRPDAAADPGAAGAVAGRLLGAAGLESTDAADRRPGG